MPEEPGLGVEMDVDAIETYRVDKADHALPRRMIKVNRPSGLNVYFANTKQKWVFFGNGNMPVDEWGSSTEYLDDDGSKSFEELFARAEVAPVVTRQ